MRASAHATIRRSSRIATSLGERERLVLVVGDENRRGAGGGENAYDVAAQRGAQRLVERAEGLVEQHDAGSDGERPGQRDPLLLAAGELVGIAAGEVGEADHLEQLGDAAALVARQAEADFLATVRWGNSAPSCGT